MASSSIRSRPGRAFRGSLLPTLWLAILVLAQAAWAQPVNRRQDTDTRDASYKLATNLAKRKKYQEAANYFFMALSGSGNIIGNFFLNFE